MNEEWMTIITFYRVVFSLNYSNLKTTTTNKKQKNNNTFSYRNCLLHKYINFHDTLSVYLDRIALRHNHWPLCMTRTILQINFTMFQVVNIQILDDAVWLTCKIYLIIILVKVKVQCVPRNFIAEVYINYE